MTHLSSLDHYSFPHIIDEILSFADPTVLRTFRLTCHQYYDTISARQARHLVLQHDGCLTSQNEIIVFVLPDDTPSPKIIKVLEHAKILDNRFDSLSFFLEPNMLSGLKELPKLEVIRLYRLFPLSEQGIPPCRTVICGRTELVPQDIERLVLFSTTMFLRGSQIWEPLRVGEIILICEGGRGESAANLASRVVDIILGGIVVSGADCKRFTIVDVEDEEVFMSNVLEDAITRTWVHRTTGARKPIIDGIQWQFLTMREYKRSLTKAEKQAIESW